VKLNRMVFGWLLLLLIVAACDAPSIPAPVSPLSTVSPVPGAVAASPVSTPTVPAMTPQPGTGGVIGRLSDIRTGQPAVITILYLEESINHDAPPLLYGPLSGQPRTDSLSDGSFAFNNVPPGEYILALYSPIDILYYQQGDGKAVLIQVEEGEILDLGQVVTFIP
jgi:hypothetical protein